LAFRLADIVQQHPDLARLIDFWPTLPDETRQTILRVAGVPQNHFAEE